MQSLGCGDKPEFQVIGKIKQPKNLKKELTALVLFSFFISQFAAAEVISFPRKSRSSCQRYMASPASLENFKPRRSAEVIEMDTRRSEFATKEFFFKNYSTTESVIFGYYPKLVTDYHPLFTSANFKLWHPMNSNFIIDSKQESVVLLGFQAHNGVTFFNRNRKQTRTETEYQAVTKSHYPAHHTTYTIPPIMRLILATLEYATAAHSYVQNENLSLKTSLAIDYRLVFHNKHPGYAARDFISSWFPQNTYERNLQSSIIRFIDEKVVRSESFFYEKEYKTHVLTELRTIFKNSPEVMSSLETLEREMNIILRINSL